MPVPGSIAAGSAAALRAAPTEEAGQVEPLGTGWMIVTVVIGVMAALIAIGGMVLSFRAVSAEMVPAFGARWAWLVPIVVDMTVFVFSGVDLVLARLDMSHPLARWTVYVATAGTVVLNYSAGGNLAGRVAHVLMPAIWVVFIELMRHVVRRQVNLATASHREAIPAARWALSPWPTMKLWRRMVLWRVHSYPRALDQEKLRLGAVATARETYGMFWRFRISPLTRLQINLGEVGAADLRPDLVQTGSALPLTKRSRSARPGLVLPAAAYAPGPTGLALPDGTGDFDGETGFDDEARFDGEAELDGERRGNDYALPGAAPFPVSRNGSARGAYSAGDDAPYPNGVQQPVVPIPAAFHEAFAGAGRAAYAHTPAPSPADDADMTDTGTFAALSDLTAEVDSALVTTSANGQGNGRVNGHAVTGGASGVNGGTTEHANGTAVDGFATRRGAHAARSALDPAVSSGALPGSGPAFQPPTAAPVDFQAPPAMPPLPRRSVRESELLTAAREVERWRGLPSATRISRELGIGMPLAVSLANALRDEDGPIEQ